MLKIGEYQTLTVGRQLPQGFYLLDDEDNEVLLPQKYITDEMDFNSEVNVFVYVDSEGRDVATTEVPFLTVGEFACLEVIAMSEHGAFCDWGILKQLLIPFRNQIHELFVGQKIIVYLLLDDRTERLVGTTKLRNYLKHIAEDDLKAYQEVDIIVYLKTDLGYNVIINRKYQGLIYDNEIREPLEIGQELKGYIKPFRPDKKIDVSIHPIGLDHIKTSAQKIMELLDQNNGFMQFTDKSDSEEIRKTFGISKKLFKKSIGALYKEKMIILKDDGIYKVIK